mmetsp:Transcript_49588/g.96986  ORF Transcript_49588/g.96986 Transcript_49588/m.96986 type:complete len:217 (-) Transcript_49588:84-734(-)
MGLRQLVQRVGVLRLKYWRDRHRVGLPGLGRQILQNALLHLVEDMRRDVGVERGEVCGPIRFPYFPPAVIGLASHAEEYFELLLIFPEWVSNRLQKRKDIRRGSVFHWSPRKQQTADTPFTARQRQGILRPPCSDVLHGVGLVADHDVVTLPRNRRYFPPAFHHQVRRFFPTDNKLKVHGCRGRSDPVLVRRDGGDYYHLQRIVDCAKSLRVDAGD